ncbi:hypothetical protein EVAR_25053_1 [Eumeta japonica]|uniref:Uncharacterized protein n=1 Tax=Eumeta variegata TaxID=151549 RepID=A0A4C1V7D1_EUMVA|nr:hypothetical protein EVAR_25053_1 [Eumeta japonica]
MLSNLQELECNVSTKIHFLHLHLDRFPQNLGDFSKEQDERFHQDLRTMEEPYQGRDTHVVADCCWNLQRDLPKVLVSDAHNDKAAVCARPPAAARHPDKRQTLQQNYTPYAIRFDSMFKATRNE